MDSESEEADSSSSPLPNVLLLGLLVAICISVALTTPYLQFEFRVASVVIHRVTPSFSELLESIGRVNQLLMAFAFLTLLLLPCLWFLALCRRLATQRPGAEPLLRPAVMCHVWAASLAGKPTAMSPWKCFRRHLDVRYTVCYIYIILYLYLYSSIYIYIIHQVISYRASLTYDFL